MTYPKFKPGDKVRLVKTLPEDCRFDHFRSFQERLLAKYKDPIFTVIRQQYDDALVHVTTNQTGNITNNFSAYSWRFELVSDPVEEAKKLLAEKGYTVTPPKPKEKGKVHVYRHKWSKTLAATPNAGAGYKKDPFFELLAEVDWEEGQGL